MVERSARQARRLGATGASGCSGQVLYDQRRRLIRVVVTDAEHAQRPLGGQRDLVALPPVERRAPVRRRVGGCPVRVLEGFGGLPTRILRRYVCYYVCSLAVASAFVLLLAAFAAGVSSAGSGSVAAAAGNGRITIINQRGAPTDRPMGISTIDRRGRLHVLKRCDAGTGWRGCYSLESVDWAPDGRRLAFSVTTIAAISRYNGLHVLNIRTGRDRHLPRDGFDIDWSPDGSRFAYVEFTRFANPIGSIYMVRADGSGRTRVPTGSAGRDARLPGLPAARDWRTRRTLPGNIRSGCATVSCGWSAWTAKVGIWSQETQPILPGRPPAA